MDSRGGLSRKSGAPFVGHAMLKAHQQAPAASSPADACAVDTTAFERALLAFLEASGSGEVAPPPPAPKARVSTVQQVRKVATVLPDPLFIVPSFVLQQLKPRKLSSWAGDSQESTSQGSQCDDTDVRQDTFFESSQPEEDEEAEPQQKPREVVLVAGTAFVQTESAKVLVGAGPAFAQLESAKVPMDDKNLGKTKCCKYFLKGTCDRGDACTYAHGNRELRPKPTLFRTGLCLDYVNLGTCQYGEKCRYAHGAQELRTVCLAKVTNRHRPKKRAGGQAQGLEDDVSQDISSLDAGHLSHPAVPEQASASLNTALASFGLPLSLIS